MKKEKPKKASKKEFAKLADDLHDHLLKHHALLNQARIDAIQKKLSEFEALYVGMGAKEPEPHPVTDIGKLIKDL